MTGEKKKKKRLNRSVLLAKKIVIRDGAGRQGIGEPSVYHAVVVIFLEFFAWGLLTTPMLTVLHQTFPQHTFLMNGLIHGVKGLLSFLSAPLIGALSDVWGRKSFLLLTVFFTCAPIPLMKISPWWYFAVISMSGVFAVTFSVIFAYVADITQEHERSTAYGLVSATFAASLVTSPAIGAYLSQAYSDTLVVVLASGVALLDIGFILLAVPESLPEEMRPVSWGAPISWEQADPFASLRKVGQDSTVLLICITVFLSYLPEAGQYSSFFLYLRQVIGFSSETVAAFIGVVGILSILAQTVVLGILMRSIGNKNTILLGLGFQILQLAWYGFGSQPWMMWAAGAVAAMSSITFPAISAMVSRNADPDQQAERNGRGGDFGQGLQTEHGQPYRREQHHPGAPVPLRGVLRAALAAGGPVHPGAQPGAAAGRPQEAQRRGAEPAQPAARRRRRQRAAARGQQRLRRHGTRLQSRERWETGHEVQTVPPTQPGGTGVPFNQTAQNRSCTSGADGNGRL
ncbi:hippocampus abundant transcript 1 protein-like isoform X1 [Caloenas nicobarica]|uniref:hippocampus abundant transcript 1 protein-like isoform X1 n=1 Tax=Caloenas nicobarica TaxID=187106 RepID=UPI0032B790E0